MKYIFNEDKLINELRDYVDNTYNEHYASKGRIQVAEFIASHCDSPDFFIGNVIKYAARYGHKEGYNRKDLLKALHYLIMSLDWHDKNAKELPTNEPKAGKIVTDMHVKPFYDKPREDFKVSNTEFSACDADSKPLEEKPWNRLEEKHYGERDSWWSKTTS